MFVCGAAVAACAGFVALAGFQVFMAAGGSSGGAAWGGSYDKLPAGLRVASGVSAIVWLSAVVAVLTRAGFWTRAMSPRVARIATWALVALLTIGAAMNAASSSGWERYLMAPLAAALALLCLVIARRQETDPEAENLGLSSP